MISIEAYRASIGRFCDKCRLLSSCVEFNTTMSCFFAAYLNYLVLQFNKIFGVFLLEFYNSSFLRRILLLIDGDIESNPGPTQDINSKSPGGRPKKMKGFRGTPKKCDFSRDVDFNVTRDTSIPLGLINQGENVCFFNSVIQVLYSLPIFKDYIQQLQPIEGVVSEMKSLFKKIENSSIPVRTSSYVPKLGLYDYVLGMQYDAHECLLQLLASIYPNVNDDCMFKIDKLESTLCVSNDCGHTINSDGACIDWSLHIEDSHNLQTISGILHDLMDPNGRPLQGYKCDGCKRLNTSTKAVCVTQLSDILIIQLNIFKFIDGLSKKVIPTLNIDEEISFWGNTMVLCGIIYHEGEQSGCGHYTSGVKINNSWFLISDTIVSSKQKLTCTRGDTSVPYILIYKKRNDVVIDLPNPLNETLQSNSIGATEVEFTVEMRNRQSLLKELEKQKGKITIAQEKKHNSNESLSTAALNEVKSPVKRKKKFSETLSRKRVKTFRDNLDDGEKTKIKDNEKNRLKKMRDNLDDDEKTEIKSDDKQRKKEKRDNLDDDEKTKIKSDDIQRKKGKRETEKDERNAIFNDVQACSMVDPCILKTPAFKLIEKEFKGAIQEGPTYICDICWRSEYRKSVKELKESKYSEISDLFNECKTGKSKWICGSCDASLREKKKMPMLAQANNLELCPKIAELEDLCPIELMLISQIIPFMFIVAKTKGAQHGLKGQCVLVPTDLKKVQTILPRSCDEEYLISLALKRRLTDKSAVNKQNIRPAAVNRALKKLTEINPFYENVTIDSEWEDLSEQSDPELWRLLTDENTSTSKNDEQTDSDDNIEGNDHLKEKEIKMSSVPFPTVMHNIDGPNISPSEIVNIAPGEGQIPVSFTSEPDWEALSFPKNYSTGKNHYNEKREIHITPSKYVHARLKCCDDRFASNAQYIFQALDWIERNAVASSIHFAERKQFQSEFNVGQLVNPDNIRRMISDDQIFSSFKNIRGTPQYFHNMLLDVLAKIRQFGVYTFFLTCSAAEFHWTEIIQILARQYGENLTDEQVNEMDWSTKVKYLKRNPVTVARQIDYVFRQLWGKVILSGMHPIGQVLNFDDRREFQKRGTEHMHVPIHVVDAPKIDENEDNEVVEFIDKYITCSLPDENKYPEISGLVKKLQTHHHTTTCRKKKGVTCRFNAPWPPSNETRIVRSAEYTNETVVKKSKKLINKVLSYIVKIGDLSNITQTEILEKCGVTEEEYHYALGCAEKKISIVYKRRPSEVNIGPYNTVILKLLKSNMNIQFVTGIYAMLTYLTSYLCKPEHTMSELMKKASKEAYGKDIRGKMHSIGNVFLTT